ncbi:MAG: TonB-dependent receptor, partial [Verrucomicrobiaceae bacterium]
AWSASELRWETVRMLNIGLDFKAKNNIIYGSVDLFRKSTRDLLNTAPIDYTSGIGSTVIKNVAETSGTNGGLPYFLEAISSNLISWSAFSTVNDWSDEALRKFASAATVARMVTLPAPRIVTVLPETTAGPLTISNTASDPRPLTAPTSNGASP